MLSITVATYVDEQRHLGMSADLHWQENYEAGDPDGVLAQVSSSVRKLILICMEMQTLAQFE